MLTKTERKAMIESVKPMSFTINLSPLQVFDYAGMALDETIFLNYGLEEEKLSGIDYTELIAELANDNQFRKMLTDEIEYRIYDGMDSVYLCEEDIYRCKLVKQFDNELYKMQEILEESEVDYEMVKAIELLKKKGYKISK